MVFYGFGFDYLNWKPNRNQKPVIFKLQLPSSSHKQQIKSLFSEKKNLFLFFFEIKQRGIEILLEHGADVNVRTNNDETVLDLCDDPDVREFIMQKSREIETEQQKQAAARAAAAALQMKLQMINSNGNSNNSTNNTNNSLNNTSQNLLRNGGGDKTNSNNNINNSTRSLKRTSTGVSRR